MPDLKHMDIAYSQLGIAETPGPDATPQIVRYFAEIGRGDVVSDEVSWCAAFAGWVCKEAGTDIAMVPQAEALLARSYARVGRQIPLDKPRPGALAVFKRDEAGPHAGHVGFVVGATASHIMLLGGNQKNSVSIGAYPRADLLALRWIVPEPSQTELLATSRIAAAAARQQKDAAKITTVPPGGHVALPNKVPDIGAVKGQMSEWQSFLQQGQELAAFVGGKWWVIALALCAWWGLRMAWDAYQIRQFRAQDAAEGKTLS